MAIKKVGLRAIFAIARLQRRAVEQQRLSDEHELDLAVQGAVQKRRVDAFGPNSLAGERGGGFGLRDTTSAAFPASMGTGARPTRRRDAEE